ncbi:MAG: hypothetical protein RH949_02750 [Coleofasciculus sp. A1-SPW-01]|uniref:hypothetical protein n=1 Tax=Coleofasciculus sp. A1-SPW-01 TaxID=3070819 RepID=UPI0032F5FBC9
MRLSIWNSYTPDTSFLLYPAYSGLFLNSFNPSYNSRFYRLRCISDRPCALPPPPDIRNRRRRFLNNGLNWRPESDNSRNSILTFFNQDNQNEPEEEEPITDIVIPMALYLYNFFESNLISGSNSPIFSSKHYPLYHFCNNYLVH